MHGPDKIIVSNGAALKRKYGAAGEKKVRAAVKKLVDADAKRGLATKYFDLSDAATMSGVGGAAISADDADDAKLAKNAVDAVFAHGDARPAYLMILGSVDVVPHVALKNPLQGLSADERDDDRNVPSDLPYACDKPFSANAQDFTAPSRVVGRLPNVTNDKDPAALVSLLQTAANYAARPASAYVDFLGVSAHVWRESTKLSLDAVFGSHADLMTSPKKGPRWTAAQAKRLVHFINCHGAPADSHFYGEDDDENMPIAHSSSWMGTRVAEGTIAAAECCYGAELYDPSIAAAMGWAGLCNTYLGRKAYAFLGSSTIAYGPADANDQADLICQKFLLHVLSGASAGRACLQSRLDYVTGKNMVLTPFDLKTLAQFNLMGDPSVTPVELPSPNTMIPKSAAKTRKGLFGLASLARHERSLRRVGMEALAAAVSPLRLFESVATAVSEKSTLIAKLRKLASDFGIKNPDAVLSFSVGAPTGMEADAKAMFASAPTAVPTAVHAIIQRMKSPASVPHLPMVRGVQAVEYADGIVAQRLFSR